MKDATRRPTCSACGLSKRYIMNRAALEGGFPVVATGHNLDDEAATLFGSTLRWDESALARQTPVLAATHPRLARRVKPLFRMSERETAAYAFLRGIDYIVEECPFSRGATSITHKELLNRLEDTSPGSKAMFLQGFLDKARGLFQERETVTLLRVRPVRPDHDRRGLRLLQAPRPGEARRAATGGARPGRRALRTPEIPPAARGLDLGPPRGVRDPRALRGAPRRARRRPASTATRSCSSARAAAA